MFSITINGIGFSVNPATDDFVTPTTTLAEFIRNRTNWRGTKVSCSEGGCGACTVAVTYTDIATGKPAVRSINSCLALLLSLNGMKVLTNEGIGNKSIGYHPIQQKLAALSGTQCGYCSSGMVMLLYAFLQEEPNPSPADLERILDGNLCRCTGYRPILDTFKSFSSTEATLESYRAQKKCMKENCCQKIKKECVDIELAHTAISDEDEDIEIPSQLSFTHVTTKKKPTAAKRGVVDGSSTSHKATLEATSVTWQDVTTLQELSYYVALAASSNQVFMISVGATSRAIYPQPYSLIISAGSVPDLNVLTQSALGLTIGSAVSINDTIAFVASCTTSEPFQVQHFQALVDHLGRIAGVSIRNRASIGGNLMVCQQNQGPTNYFASDACIALMGLNATVTLQDATGGAPFSVSLTSFLALQGKKTNILLAIFIPFAASSLSVYKTYKIAKRRVMSHAIVNAAFHVTVHPTTNVITSGPVIAIGGVLSAPTRITVVEALLVGKNVTSVADLQTVCAQLQQFLSSNVAPGGGRIAYRVQTAVNFLYKFFIALQPAGPPTDLERASRSWMVRPVSTATQTFGTDPTEYPVSLPIPKIDGLAQTSGEAMFTTDVPAPLGMLHGAVVQTTLANATISSVNASVVDNIAGFVKYFDNTSIPAANNNFGVGPLFALSASNFAGQCVGLVVATMREVALQCAAMIQATIVYTNAQTPILTAAQSLAAGWIIPGFPVPPVSRGADPSTIFPTCKNVVKGTIEIGSQYHIHLENHAAVVRPIEGQYVIECCSQGPILIQTAVSTVLGVPASKVQVTTRRAGGGFGAKVTAINFTASLAAVAARALSLPVSVELTLQDPLRCLGARPQYMYQYEAGLDENNKILALQGTLYLACGFNPIDIFSEAPTALGNLDNCYNIPNFSVSSVFLKTNIPPATSVRGPGWIQAILLAEMVMNAIANTLSISPRQLRETNFYQRGDIIPNGMTLQTCNLQRVWDAVKTSSNFTQRAANVAAFNAANKFVKRGISINPTRFGVSWVGAMFNSTVAVYGDGSIAITHGGCEIGQGINTKVAQVCAYKFGLTEADIPNIKIQPSNTQVTPNPGNETGGSITSELCCLSVMYACEELCRRLQPFRLLGWNLACRAASQAGVDMLATGYASQPTFPTYPRYNSWGCAVSEVEVDGLSGEFEIKQTDIVFDCGISLNPAVDVGQVEGGFTLGLGWFTQETVHWDPTSGRAMDATTWEYKPPAAADIPEVLNVTLLENAANHSGVLSSKACGEPPCALAVSVALALEDAINTVRSEIGLAAMSVTSIPLGVDSIANSCGVSSAAFNLA